MPPANTPFAPAPRAVLRYVGDYELLGEIARGGMGSVHRARQRSLDRLVALKLIHPQLAGDAQAVERFRREARAAAGLAHPGIVPIFEVGEDAGQLFYAMELVEGSDLGRVLKSGALAPARAAELVHKLARALAHAHERGVLHRDLKPANVLVDAHGEPRITDFGLARGLGGTSLTHSGDVLGTPAYMAPEQARGAQALVGAASDVYGLGAILFHCLTGRAPFEGPQVLAVLHHVLEQEPPRPSALKPGIPADLEAIALRCLEKDLGLRYASASELADDLQRFLAGQPVLARPPGRWRRLAAWWRAHPLARAGLIGALIVALASFAFYLWSYLRWIEAGRPAPDKNLDDALSIALVVTYALGMPGFFAGIKLQRLRQRRRRHGELVPARSIRWCLRLGTLSGLCGLVGLAIGLESLVWAGHFPWAQVFGRNFYAIWGTSTAIAAWNERNALLRSEPIELSEAELAQIRERMLACDELAAIRLYRKRTRAELAECRAAVRSIAGLPPLAKSKPKPGAR